MARWCSTISPPPASRGLERVILAGDRGTLTSARLREDLKTQTAIDWITVLRAPQIQSPAAGGGRLQMSLFDKNHLAEIHHADYTGERLIACRNPLPAEERARKRKELLEATEKALNTVLAATKSPGALFAAKRRSRCASARCWANTKWPNTSSVSFRTIPSLSNACCRRWASAEDAVRYYKELSHVERAFRSLKSVDLLTGARRSHIARPESPMLVHPLVIGFLASGHPENHRPLARTAPNGTSVSCDRCRAGGSYRMRALVFPGGRPHREASFRRRRSLSLIVSLKSTIGRISIGPSPYLKPGCCETS